MWALPIGETGSPTTVFLEKTDKTYNLRSSCHPDLTLQTGHCLFTRNDNPVTIIPGAGRRATPAGNDQLPRSDVGN